MPGAHKVLFPRENVARKDYIRSLLNVRRQQEERQQDENKKTDDMRVSCLGLGITADCTEDTDADHHERHVAVAAAQAPPRGKAKRSDASHSTRGVTGILKLRQKESERLPVTKNLRSGNYVRETMPEANQSTLTIANPSPWTVTFSTR